MSSRKTPSNCVGAAPVVPRTELVVTMSAARSAHEALYPAERSAMRRGGEAGIDRVPAGVHHDGVDRSHGKLEDDSWAWDWAPFASGQGRRPVAGRLLGKALADPTSH